MKRLLIMLIATMAIMALSSCTAEVSDVENHISVTNNTESTVWVEIFQSSDTPTGRYERLAPGGYMHRLTESETEYTMRIYISDGSYYTITDGAVSENDKVTFLGDVEVTTTPDYNAVYIKGDGTVEVLGEQGATTRYRPSERRPRR